MSDPTYSATAQPYAGVDRAQPITPNELEMWLANIDVERERPLVVGYYLPSPYANVQWTKEQADVLAGNPRVYPLPIYVAALALTQGDGTKYADEAIALCRVYPNHSVVVLDIEEEAESTTPTAILALDIQEQVAREFIAEIAAGSELVPVIYGSRALYERIISNVWVASWLPAQAWPVGGPYMPGVEPWQGSPVEQEVPRPVGWQYSGDDTAPFLVPDLSLWLPFLFTEPDNYSQEWRDMQKHTTKEGDTLESIATELYGKAGAVVSAIYNANIRRLRSYGPRGEIPAGTVLTVPSVASSDDTEAHEVASPAVAVPASTAKAPVAGSPKAAADTAPPADDVATAPPATTEAPPAPPVAVPPAPPVAKTTSFEERIASLVKDYADELDAALSAYLSTHKAAILEAAVAALTKVLEAL